MVVVNKPEIKLDFNNPTLHCVACKNDFKNRKGYLIHLGITYSIYLTGEAVAKHEITLPHFDDPNY